MITMQEGKLRVLCLHGFRTSAAIFEKQIHRWDSSILQLLDLNFLDKPYAAFGKLKGGVLAAAFEGLQQKGMVLQGHPPLCFIILVSRIGLNNKQAMHECYSEIVLCPFAHIIGDQDCLRKVNEELMQKFKNPLVIRHQEKHTVPRLGEEQTKLLRDFLI
ncbi:hypothetical protein L7F22_041667 [Adiantum nelumboides]|nr:hypothetical protein [Adiantum nelumboides]